MLKNEIYYYLCSDFCQFSFVIPCFCELFSLLSFCPVLFFHPTPSAKRILNPHAVETNLF